MKVAITGVGGFIGGQLLPVLAGRHSVRALVRRAAVVDDRIPGVEWLVGDIAEARTCARLLDGVDGLIHLGQAGNPVASNSDFLGDAMTSLLPTLALIEALRRVQRPVHVIFASSGGAIYAERQERIPFAEDDPTAPSTAYGVTKAALENYFRLLTCVTDHSCTVLRIANPYGVLLPMDRRQGLVGVAVTRILHGKPVHVFGNPENRRDYIHTDDLNRAFLQVLAAHPHGFGVYNVGSGQGYTVTEVLGLLRKAVGRDFEIVSEAVDYSSILPSWSVLNVRKALADFSWRPEIDLETGIRRMVNEATRDRNP